jgi:Trk K+ transport system NAD-binding subunit
VYLFSYGLNVPQALRASLFFEKVDGGFARDGQPVIVDDACDLDALTDANVQGADVVLITSNNIETSLLVTKRAREHHPECRIIARCFQDGFVEILESLGANDIISSSKNAFDDIVARVEF